MRPHVKCLATEIHLQPFVVSHHHVITFHSSFAKKKKGIYWFHSKITYQCLPLTKPVLSFWLSWFSSIFFSSLLMASMFRFKHHSILCFSLQGLHFFFFVSTVYSPWKKSTFFLLLLYLSTYIYLSTYSVPLSLCEIPKLQISSHSFTSHTSLLFHPCSFCTEIWCEWAIR